LLNPPHNIKAPINEKHAKFNAINLKSLVSREGTSTNKKIPIIGKTNT
jgi:hypothetical protein